MIYKQCHCVSTQRDITLQYLLLLNHPKSATNCIAVTPNLPPATRNTCRLQLCKATALYANAKRIRQLGFAHTSLHRRRRRLGNARTSGDGSLAGEEDDEAERPAAEVWGEVAARPSWRMFTWKCICSACTAYKSGRGYYLQDHVVLRAACQIHLHSIS